MARPTVLLCQSSTATDHFAGVETALEQRGYAAERVFPLQPFPRLHESIRAVAVSDVESFLALRALREARRAGIPTVLLMDGIVEWRNTFLNPNVDPAFLRPAPVDVIACASPVDARILTAWGNHAVATGLPRFDPVAAMHAPLPSSPRLLIATARQPAFTPEEHESLVRALRLIQSRCAHHGIPVDWRITGGLADDLAVVPDDRPLMDALRDASAVISTMSSLVIEAMLAQRPTVVLHPFGTPLLQAGPMRLQRALHDRDEDFARRIDDTLIALTDRPEALVEDQSSRVLPELYPAEDAASTAAECLVNSCATKTYGVSRCLPPPIRLPEPCPRPAGIRRIVNCIHVEGSPVGGVTTWALRLAQCINQRSSNDEMRVLFIGYHPDIARVAQHCGAYANDVPIDTCIIDPTQDHAAMLGAARDAIARLEPDIVLPNYGDVCYAAACQLQHRGVRFVAIAHTDQAYYRDLLGQYNTWESAVGVSEKCISWIRELDADRADSARQIVYGVPVASQPRTVDVTRNAPLRIAYVGRIVQEQKRIFDLLGVIDGLEQRAVPYELHMIGDGPDLDAWRAQLRARTLAHGTVRMRGRRTPDWVQAFLPTVDISVLVSDYEGTSITMLEAMGVGVVPVVTAVDSGVDDWICDGHNGVVVPIGNPDQMAARIADLHRDRDQVARLGEAAWTTIRSTLTIEHMTDLYLSVFDDVMENPRTPRPTDLGVRVMDEWRWTKMYQDDPDAAIAFVESSLRETGFRAVVFDEPTDDADAVIVRERAGLIDDDTIDAWRAQGLGVAFAPHLRQNPTAFAMRQRLESIEPRLRELVDTRDARIAIYGTGQHTRRATAVLQDSTFPIVGFIDDAPPPWKRFIGRPIVTLDEAMNALRPDVVVLSSDAWEEQMWHRCAPLREQGVLVLPLYGEYESSVPSTARVVA